MAWAGQHSGVQGHGASGAGSEGWGQPGSLQRGSWSRGRGRQGASPGGLLPGWPGVSLPVLSPWWGDTRVTGLGSQLGKVFQPHRGPTPEPGRSPTREAVGGGVLWQHERKEGPLAPSCPPSSLHHSVIRLFLLGLVNTASGLSGSDSSIIVGTPLGGPGGCLLLDGVSACPSSGVCL